MTAATETRQPAQAVRVSTTSSLLAIIPHLLGFEPADSVVIIGTENTRGRIKVTIRYDLPDPADLGLTDEITGHALSVLAGQGIETAVAVIYGPADLADPVAKAWREATRLAGVQAGEVIRANDGRYWSYSCTKPDCCPPEGTHINHADPPASVLVGSTRPLPSRAALAHTLAPVTGYLAEAMDRETRRAENGIVRLITKGGRKAVRRSGLKAVSTVIDQYRRGEPVPQCPTMARLSLVLRDLAVRDDAWARMDIEHARAHAQMWTDLTRLARPGYVAAPATLLAFVAWQQGNGALANTALDRALADDGQYSMARLLRLAIDSGTPPSAARLPMTPEEVAASYAEQEDPEEHGDDVEDAPPEDDDCRHEAPATA